VDNRFRDSLTYENVYFLFVDAAGYSTIVRSNPRDQAASAFDLVRERFLWRLMKISDAHRCMRTELWSWLGDGGLCAIHDDNESVARDVALETGLSLLSLDLRHLQEEFPQLGLRGDLHVRLSIHKGTIRFLGEDRTGHIHSPDISFGAHLEQATPRDSLAISEDVYQVAGRYTDLFQYVGDYEGKRVHLTSPAWTGVDPRRAWITARGLAGSGPLHSHHERPSQAEKARLVSLAMREIVNLGTALNLTSNFLLTSDRPALYRDAVLDFLERGGTYRCVLMDPECDVVRSLSDRTQEDLSAKISRSIANFTRFQSLHTMARENFHVYHTRVYPELSALAIDPDLPEALILYSPYLLGSPKRDRPTERGDLPHYLVTEADGELFEKTRTLIESFFDAGTSERVL
jgi:class 3 adenylate cyclase